MANFYRDIFINKGDDFTEVIEISVPFNEYDFTGTVRSSVASLVGIPITCEAVDGDNRKMRISIPSELTSTLSRRRGVYSILATNKLTEEQVTERQGTAHYSQAPSFVPAAPPPPNYVVSLENIEGAGSAAAADVEDFATAEQGDLAETAIQATSVSGAIPVEDLTDKEFLLKGSPIDSVTWTKLKELLQAYFDNIYGGTQLITADTWNDVFFVSDIPDLGTPAFIADTSKFVKYIGNTGEGRIGHVISGLPVVEANGKFALVGTTDNRNSYYSAAGFYLMNEYTVVDDIEYNRWLFRNDNWDIIAYSNFNSYSYPFAFELTWYDAADDSEIEVVFEDWIPGSYYSWQVDTPDLVPEFQNGIFIRNQYGWQQIPEFLENFFNAWSLQMAKDSLEIRDLLFMTSAELAGLGSDWDKPRLVYTTDTGVLHTINIQQDGTQAKPLQIKYIYRHDYDALNSFNYLGKAIFGSLETDPVWTVTRLTISSAGGTLSEPALTLIAWTDRANPLNYNV